MSFILDALRKSERERQRIQEPSIAETWAHGKRGNRAFWVPLVLLLVGLNLSLLVFLWIKGGQETAEENGIANIESDIALIQPTVNRPEPVVSGQAADQETRRLSAEIPASDTREQAIPAPARPQPASTPVRSSSSDEYRNLPSLMELTLAGSVSLPPLRLDIHVYSEQPAERFVFINMSKYREGGALSEGPVVNAITSEGVVLEYQGRSFVLARE